MVKLFTLLYFTRGALIMINDYIFGISSKFTTKWYIKLYKFSLLIDT